MTDALASDDVLSLATEITSAWLSNPNTRAGADEAASFLERMRGVLSADRASAPSAAAQEDEAGAAGAVSVRKSLASKDHIISMIDGKPYKTLRRHLTRHGMTPESYRERYGLRADYPMVAENYSAQRRDMAKRIGLGTKPRAGRGRAKAA